MRYLYYFLTGFYVVSFLAAYVSPAVFWPAAFIAFLFPYLFILLIICSLILLLSKTNRKKLWLSLVVLVLSFGSWQSLIPFSFNKEEDGKAVKIMTYNVKSFDLYNWTHNKNTHQKIMDFIQKENPDILCLQEFYHQDREPFQNVQQLKEMGYSYYHYGKSIVLTDKNLPRSWGVITFSKYPIIEKNTIKFENSLHNLCIKSNIRIADDVEIAVYNMHLESLHFGYDDYKYISELGNDNQVEVEGSKKILYKMYDAFRKRAKQVQEVKSQFKPDERKIICGDMNDTPFSYTYKQLSKQMNDAYTFGSSYSTYIGHIPFIRIDDVLLDKSLKKINYRVADNELSDHKAVIVNFKAE